MNEPRRKLEEALALLQRVSQLLDEAEQRHIAELRRLGDKDEESVDN